MDFCERALQEAHVALTPGNDFGEHQGDHYVRLSFASAESELTEGLQRLERFMKSLKSAKHLL